MKETAPKKNENQSIPSTSGVKVAEIHMLEHEDPLVLGSIQEVMIAKRDRPLADLEAHTRNHHKRGKTWKGDGPSRSKRSRRKIGLEDLLLSRSQAKYSIVKDLSKQNADITIGQLIARCPFLKRKLRQGINTKIIIDEVQVTQKLNEGIKAPQVTTLVHGHEVEGCLLDGEASVNVMSK